MHLSYADHLEGPWQIHRPGVLEFKDSFFDSHIASPDVHVLDDSHEIRMYYHVSRMPEKHRNLRHRAGPLGTEGTAWHVAWAAAFLASDESRWMSGVALRHLQQDTDVLSRVVRFSYEARPLNFLGTIAFNHSPCTPNPIIKPLTDFSTR